MSHDVTKNDNKMTVFCLRLLRCKFLCSLLEATLRSKDCAYSETMNASYSNRHALESIPETHNNGSGWDDSARGDPSTNSDDERNPIHDIEDVPLDESSMRELKSEAGSSLPHIEELKMTTSGSRRSVWNSKLFRGRRKLYLGGLVLLLVLILSISLPKSKNNESSKSAKPDTVNTATNSSINTSGQRYSTKEEVFAFLERERIYLDLTYIESTVKSPQNRAAAWLSREDRANLKVPDANADASTKYSYLTRYVMAVNYYALDGPNQWTNKLGFLTPRSVCTWQGQVQYSEGITEGGVFCPNDRGDPTDLRLGFVKAIGQIPTENGLLTSLTNLDFGTSRLSGTIPTEICKIWNLTKLDLSYNELSGKLPPCLGTRTDLKWIFANSNALVGTIPTQFKALTQLERLVLEDNMLTGDPTPVLNSLTRVQHVFLGDNNFTGVIDSTFMSGHKSLAIMDVSQNQFRLDTSANFPHHLLSLANLSHLDLSVNPLHGSFPKVLLSSKITSKITNHKLQFISVYDTNMNGELPHFDRFAALQFLDLSLNSFHGTIPSYNGSFPQLELLYLSDNPRLSPGAIPTSFQQLSKLSDLSMRGTNRGGTIPSFIGSNLTNLVLVDLGVNNFTSSVPSDFSKLKKLEYLLLNGNLGLNGGLGSLTHQLGQLKVLLLDGTNISAKFQCPPITNTSSDLVAFVDCPDDNPPCICCMCCDVGSGAGCSEPLLANIDASWKNSFNRSTYKFFENDEYGI
jgi:Leucine-rich repeat (LRR) protein